MNNGYDTKSDSIKNDLQIEQDVIAELEWDAAIDATQLAVEVSDGVVTLAGHLNNFAEKWYAERAVQNIAGVKALAIKIDVALTASTLRKDTDIAHIAENVLQWVTYWPKDTIKVMVDNGWITLSGEVDLEYHRKAAEDCVRHLKGVTGVSNQITLKPKSSLKVNKSEIEAALSRRVNADAQSISVKVKGSNVTLSGNVNSWHELELARQAAWGTLGVTNVVDDLTVSYAE